MRKKEEESSQRLRVGSHFSSLEQWFVNYILSQEKKTVMPLRKPNDYSILKKAHDILRFSKYLCSDVKKYTFAKGSTLIPIYKFL